MNPVKYFSKQFYSEKLDVEKVLKFIEELGNRKEFSVEELLAFIQNGKDKSIKKEFLLEHFNEIIDEQWKNDKRNMCRRDFLEHYFEDNAPFSDDTLTKWRKTEPKKDNERLRLLPALEKMSVAKQMFNSYYYRSVWETHFNESIRESDGRLRALKLAMLSHEYSIDDILFRVVCRVSSSIADEIKDNLSKKQKYLLSKEGIYNFRVNSNTQIISKIVVENILKTVNLSEISYSYPTDIEIYNKILTFLKDEIYWAEIDSERPELEIETELIENNSKWSYTRKEYQGLKNNRLIPVKQFKQKRYIKIAVSYSNISSWKKNIVLSFSRKKKVVVKTVKNLQGEVVERMEEVDKKLKSKFYLELIYTGMGNFDYSISRRPIFNKKVLKNNIIKKQNSQLIFAKMKQLRLNVIKYFFNVNVILKKRILKLDKNKLTDYQRQYNHFELLESLDRRRQKMPNLLKLAQERDYFSEIGDIT